MKHQIKWSNIIRNWGRIVDEIIGNVTVNFGTNCFRWRAAVKIKALGILL